MKVAYVKDGDLAVRVWDLVEVIELYVLGKRLNSHSASLPQVDKWVTEKYILGVTLW